MGGSAFFFVESKTFEFSVKKEGSFYLLRIYRRGWNSLCYFSVLLKVLSALKRKVPPRARRKAQASPRLINVKRTFLNKKI